MKELAGFPPPCEEELVVCRVAADLILFPTHSFAVTSSLTGDESCMVAAEIGFCSGHPCPWSKSKVPNVYAANSSTCSQNARVLEEDFLGKLASRREALVELQSLVTTVLFWGAGGNPNKAPAAFLWWSSAALMHHPSNTLKLMWGGVNFGGKYLHHITAQSTMICKQQCPRDYLQTCVRSPSP